MFGMAETALVVLFRELEPLIGELRRRHTTSGAEGLGAHATLIVPFAESPTGVEPLALVARTVAPFPRFEVVLNETAIFPSSADGPATLYLAPEPAEKLIALTAALARAFPDFPPYRGEFDELVPHVTVAQGDDALLRGIEQGLRPRLPVRTRAERVWLVEHTASGWRRTSAFPLIGSEPA
jgi:2'-5' RNA ligase